MIDTVKLWVCQSDFLYSGGVSEAQIMRDLLYWSLSRYQQLLVKILVEHFEWGVGHHHLVLCDLSKGTYDNVVRTTLVL